MSKNTLHKTPVIWIMDTSIFTNILDVPGRNQNRKEVLSLFKSRIDTDDSFLMPYAAIIETGNHIAHLDGNYKYTYANKFIEQLKLAIEGQAPWKPMKFPTHEDLQRWLDNFPEFCGKGIGFGDYSIIKEWEAQKDLFKGYSVRIWTLDHDLQGYES